MAWSPIPLAVVPWSWCPWSGAWSSPPCPWWSAGGGHGPQECGPIPMKDRTHGLPHLVHVVLSWVLLHHIHDGHPMALQCCAHRWLLGSHNLDKSMAAGGPGLWKAIGRPHASKLVHSPWSGAPWAGTWPAGSWGASACKAFPMAVSPGGWNAFGKHTAVLAWH